MTDADLYLRGIETLLASWAALARAARGATLRRLRGVAVAVFVNEPERAVYNNAVFERGLGPAERAHAVDAMEELYTAVGVTRFAAWAHETDGPLRGELERRGYTLDASTRAMGLALTDVRLPRPELELAPSGWLEHLRIIGAPPTLLGGAEPAACHVLTARLQGENVATAMAFDHGGDCGLYNLTTLAHARRHGVATALTALHVLEARARGCETASLQATAMAEGLYASVGFRDLGRIVEYAPPR